MPLFAELKRRNVFKVGAAYLALAWVVVQITGTVVPAFGMPAWVLKFVIWLGAIGFPFALLFSWAYELTPDGLRRESEIDRGKSITHVTGKRLDYVIIALLVVAIGLFVADRLVPVGAGNSNGPRDSNAGPGTESAEEDRGHGPLPQETPTAAPDEKSIAVLPFVNMSSDKEQDYFSDGISEELLNLLAKIPQLSVAARTSSFSFKDTKLEIPEIAAKLRVAHVLEGSVRKSGSKVRITAQLVRAADGYHLWSETWDRELTDIFAVQDEIAGSVVTQLKVTLLGDAPKSRVTDPKAYALFLQGRQLSEQFTPEAYEKSNALLEQVLAIDPNYPEALRKLAANAINQAYFGLRPIDEAYAQAREYVARALAIDPDYGRGYDGLAIIALNYDHDVATAARHYQRALELDPTNTNILTNAAALTLSLGRLDLAVAMNEYSVSKDPVSPLSQSNLAFAYQCARRYDDAIVAYRTASSLSPGFLGAHAGMAWDLLLKGDATAALEEARKEPGEIARLPALAVALHALGQHAESDAALAQLIEKYEKFAAFSIASALAFRGENDRAFEWLDKAVAYHDGSLFVLGVDPSLANLHADPRWLPFLRREGLAPEQVAAIEFTVKLPGK